LQVQSTGKTDSSKEKQAFTMLKHGFAALMILHDAETPLCSTVHFMMLKLRCAALFTSPMLKLRYAALFISLMPKHR
jgi:hypothetical protein